MRVLRGRRCGVTRLLLTLLEIRKLARDAATDSEWKYYPKLEAGIKSAILAGVKLVLEREPNGDLLQAMDVAYMNTTFMDIDDSILVAIYRAMTRELLKELD